MIPQKTDRTLVTNLEIAIEIETKKSDPKSMSIMGVTKRKTKENEKVREESETRTEPRKITLPLFSPSPDLRSSVPETQSY